MTDILRRFLHPKMPIKALLHRLLHDQKGAVAPLFLVSAGLIFGVALGAIDLARYTSVKARLQTSLDNAALAAGRLASLTGPDADLLAEARAYFQANFPEAYLGSEVSANTLSLTSSNNGSSLTLNVQGRLPLLSTGFLKVSAFGLQTRSVVSLGGITDLEVVLALDKGLPKRLGGPSLTGSAAELAELLLVNGSEAVPGVYLGLVPFSDTVNVGPDGKPWVSRWQQVWNGDDKLTHSNRQYTDTVWRGCIAEPRPWEPPSASVSALTPQAIFQPVFVRVTTRINEKDNGPEWKGLRLNGLKRDEKEEVADDSSYAKSLPLFASGNQAGKPLDRRLWAEFGGRSKGKTDGDAHFLVHGAFEPENCLGGNRSHFLQNDYLALQNALANIAAEAPRGDTLLPAGLLWSWRMLDPNWRGGTGWNADALPAGDSPRKKVIVLFAGGDNASWEKVNVDPSGNPHNMEQWAETNNNFAFMFDYYVKQCASSGKDCSTRSKRVHQQTPFLPVKKKQQADDWQRPSTSLLMADPFSDTMVKPNVAGWPTMDAYTSRVCNAIKAQNIDIYVVDVNRSGHQALANCSSSTKVYSVAELEELRNRIQQARTTSAELRLVE
ncbi:pilus assembly protein [Candidimonas sp. SYP-B2681]|uniref:TadE/TadG family type IV pilus assembly protein n=1 Tax=Candidimonas sp. SYP-B2681 TaxID=2497686 RepID=UPI000F88B82B|nr:TadE/TadG family type IV pilus assembly protein [Candidimonas sp. SYP-B2681]RTZ45355.1 pilus assembly protein [Candidimonas sp. SYP-B2681]